jgi:ribosomal protein L29
MALRRPTREELEAALAAARRELAELRAAVPVDAERVREVEGAVGVMERELGERK